MLKTKKVVSILLLLVVFLGILPAEVFCSTGVTVDVYVKTEHLNGKAETKKIKTYDSAGNITITERLPQYEIKAGFDYTTCSWIIDSGNIRRGSSRNSTVDIVAPPRGKVDIIWAVKERPKPKYVNPYRGKTGTITVETSEEKEIIEKANIEEEIRRIIAKGPIKDSIMAVVQFFADQEAIPMQKGTVEGFDGIDYEQILSNIKATDDKTQIFTEKQLQDFYKFLGSGNMTAGKEMSKNNLFDALEISRVMAYRNSPDHPFNKPEYSFNKSNGYKNINGQEFKHDMFLGSLNQFRTVVAFSNDDLKLKDLWEKRFIGQSVFGFYVSNNMFPEEVSSGLNYAMHEFVKEPLRDNEWINFYTGLRPYPLLFIKRDGFTFRQNIPKSEHKRLIDSAKRGIQLMLDEPGIRKWDVERTFGPNALNPKNRNKSWEDCLMIMEFPTMYTWGYGLVNIYGAQSGNRFYSTVPLSPFIYLVPDIEIKEISTAPNPDDQGATLVTEFEVAIESIPILPAQMPEYNMRISFNAAGATIKGAETNEGQIMMDETKGSDNYTIVNIGEKDRGADDRYRAKRKVIWAPDGSGNPTEKGYLVIGANLTNLELEEKFLEVAPELGYMPYLVSAWVDKVKSAGIQTTVSIPNGSKLSYYAADPHNIEQNYENNTVLVEGTIAKTPDLIVDIIEPGVSETKPGTKHNGKVYISRAPREGQETDEPIDTTLYLSIANGKLDGEADIPIRLNPGESKTIPFTWEAGQDKTKNISIVAEINPEKLGANRLPERTYNNNKKSVVVMMEDDRVDLSIKLVQGYEALFIGETDTFGARVYNTSDNPISTDIVWKLAGKQIRKANITVPAKGSTDDKATIKMPNTAGNVMLEVEVNPSRNKPSNEVTYDNNRIRQTIENLGPDEEDQTGESDPYLVK